MFVQNIIMLVQRFVSYRVHEFFCPISRNGK